MVAEMDGAGWPRIASVLIRCKMLTPSAAEKDMRWQRKGSAEIAYLRDAISNHSSFLFLVLLAAQFGLQPLLTKQLLPRGHVPQVFLLSSNFSKILISLLILLFGNTRDEVADIARSWSLRESVLKAGLPAIMFSMQGWLLQVGQAHIDSLSFNLLNQTKTLSAALMCYLLLGKRQSRVQCFALVLLFVSALLLGTKGFSSKSSRDTAGADAGDAFFFGVLPVVTAALSSGLTAAMTQRTLKGAQGRNSWLYSMELSMWGSACLLAGVCFSSDARGRLVQGPYQGWSALSVLPVMTQAVGGILVGLVTKYSDSVKKGFALVSGIVLTTLAQAVLEDAPLTSGHLIAAVLVAISTVLHAEFPPVQLRKAKSI
ncbi:ROCK1 [Symbiodinium natans]|uniref:ROCK1 protein n=1 Tax=Symbiodinium natans TaxID=878477 RepID=A0A812JLU5_9DINO|nr:ROCK1 [Symbiodinium natans]